MDVVEERVSEPSGGCLVALKQEAHNEPVGGSGCWRTVGEDESNAGETRFTTIPWKQAPFEECGVDGGEKFLHQRVADVTFVGCLRALRVSCGGGVDGLAGWDGCL